MPSESEIIAEIEKHASTYYRIWTIGITEDPTRRRQEHHHPIAWYDWDAITETSARNIEKHFLDKGMNGDTGSGTYPHHVYIFI